MFQKFFKYFILITEMQDKESEVMISWNIFEINIYKMVISHITLYVAHEQLMVFRGYFPFCLYVYI